HHDATGAVEDRVVARRGRIAAADLDDRAIARRDIAGEHAMLRVDRQDRPAAKDAFTHGSSRPLNASGNSSASVQLRRSPAGLTATTVTFVGSAACSRNTCRHAPHGELGGDASVATATASSTRPPAATAAAIALRSAHTLNGYDAFSTLTPS